MGVGRCPNATAACERRAKVGYDGVCSEAEKKREKNVAAGGKLSVSEIAAGFRRKDDEKKERKMAVTLWFGEGGKFDPGVSRKGGLRCVALRGVGVGGW